MAIVCSNCDVVPDEGTVVGGACTKCGERLLAVDTGDDLIGKNVDGRFRVVALLGRGGMGLVYRARQLSIGRDVALKVVDRRFEKDVAAVKRFFREAKLASTLQHPNTVPIIEFGQNQDGRLYLAMELVKGGTLLDEMNRVGAMPLSRLVVIGTQLCDALETAHDLQIVHRDLKLENVMLLEGKRDHVKILDFGLARSLVDPSTAMTATGLISGTPRYMPPEVGIDAAAPAASQDMYSVGVMLAELSVGHPLWTSTSIAMLFAEKLDTDASIKDVPAVLKPLIRSLLATEPEKRPTAAQTRALLRDLESRSAPSIQIELDPDPAPPPVSALGGAKFARAASPIALAPTTEFSVEVVDPYANPSVVGLDELPQRPPSVRAVVPNAPTSAASQVDEHDPRFASPTHEEDDAKKLQIDPAYLVERSQKQIARNTPPPPVRKSKVGWLISLLLIAVVGAGGYLLYTYKLKKPDRLTGGGVTIRITAELPREILIDGKNAGKPPVKLQVPRGTQPILISGDGLVGVSVVPDQDHDVQLKKP
jgi:serine/threonine protein kinase